MFKQASKQAAKIKMSLHGAAGSGKTFSALTLAFSLGERIAIVDTENSSASLYADKFPPYDLLDLKPPYSPERFIEAIKGAEKEGYDVIIIDSFSSEWDGQGGCLDIHTKLGGNSYTAWSKVTPRHDALIEEILRANIHIICCMRAKQSYAMEQESGQKAKVNKLGLAPVQRDNVEYNFTLCFALNQQHMIEVMKDRTGLFVGKIFIIDAHTGETILSWLNAEPKKVIECMDALQFGAIVDLYAAAQANDKFKTLEDAGIKKLKTIENVISAKQKLNTEQANHAIEFLRTLQ